ncbi:MAG: glycoside hydrolase family 88 protein [Paludibacter sp.]|jgi:rhamnogalacturonyl hydrolase YesR|nr:glycoside hydrolase family 88 protein [Paludibacter sp.]
MKKLYLIFSMAVSLSALATTPDSVHLSRSQTLAYTQAVNNYFMATYPDVTANSHVGGKERNSRIWTRGVYYEGLMAFYRQYPTPQCLTYATTWGNFHNWITTSGSGQARHADYQCCGQAYLDMYLLDTTQTVRKTHIKSIINAMLTTNQIDDWYWIDAIQMAMPIFAQLGSIEKDNRYFERMYQMYMHTRNQHGGSRKSGGLPLFNETDGLWYRDYQFDPPYYDLTESNKPCYWSRGNGWVYEALARVLYYSPDTVSHRAQYVADFRKMSEALRRCQRTDGFWNVSLAAPTNTGNAASPGPETSGTALFVAGMAYGISVGILDSAVYLPCVIRAWNALCQTAVQANGFLGYVQGSGSKPEDGQPVQATSTPDFEDFGVGCFLLAAAEMYKLGDIDLSVTKIDKTQSTGELFDIRINNKNLIIKQKQTGNKAVNVIIYNMNGAVVAKKHFNSNKTGLNSFNMSVENLAGCYLCKLTSGGSSQVRKIII